MKKWIRYAFILTTCAILISSLIITNVEAAKSTKLIVKGETITKNLPTIIDRGRTLVPLRIVGEALDAKVSWDSKKSTVTVQKWGEILTLTPNSPKALLQGTANGNVNIELDSPAKLKDGTVYVPLRLLAHTFGYDVSWNEGEIKINSPLTERTKQMLYHGSLEKARLAITQLIAPIHYINTPLKVTFIDENYDQTFIFPEGEALGYYYIYGDMLSWIELRDDFLVCTWQANIKNTSYGHIEAFLEHMKNAEGKDPKINKDMLYFTRGSSGVSSHAEYGKIDKNKTYKMLANKQLVDGSITHSEGTILFTLPGEVRTDQK